MNKIKYFFILLVAGSSLVSCNKSDNDVEVVPLNDYGEQYAVDKATIEEYLNTHYITVTESAGTAEDMDVQLDSIQDATTQKSIMSYKDNVGTAVFPQLKSKNVDFHGITYQLYYLVLREGAGDKPMNTDGVLSAYSGSYLTNVAKKDPYPAYVSVTPFEQVNFPQSVFDLTAVIMGWSEVFPEFRAGTSTIGANGVMNYADFGAGVMFLPSGLAYYGGSGTIPAYRPLVFSFKLYQVQRLDHDGDGVLDMFEDINGDGYVYDYRNTTFYPNAPTNLDDTDGDGIPDFLDVDDDGDGFTTKLEITKAATEIGFVNGVNFGPSKYFPFNAFAVVDNPDTPNFDESLNSEPRGIPAFATSGEPDYTSPGRLRLHLDKAHHTAKP